MAALLLAVGHVRINAQVFGSDTLKYNPGHYIAVADGQNVADVDLLFSPEVRGLNKRYTWRELEPEPGVYDFSSISNDLNILAEGDKQLLLFLVDKSFNGTMIMPDYLADHTITDGSTVIANRWDPYIVERLLLLGDTLAATFDTTANFEGIALQESALSLSSEVMDAYGYTTDLYRDALIEALSGLANHFKHSRVFWYMNFFPRNNNYLYQVIDALLDLNVVISGPDILPYRTGLQLHTYPVYAYYYGKLPLACSAQYHSYMHHTNDLSASEIEEVPEEGYIPMDGIFRFGRDVLKLNYIFWTYKTWAPGDEYSVYDAYEVMQDYPVFNYPLSGIDSWNHIGPDQPGTRYNGVIEKHVTDTAAYLYRFTGPYMDAAVKFDPMKARTQSGISITFRSSSPAIRMHFDTLANSSHRTRNFGVFMDGELYKDGISELDFTIENSDEEMHNWEVWLPVFSGVVFKGLDLVDGYEPEVLPVEDKPVYVAIGNSITHGVGQSHGSHLTYPYHLADTLGYRLYNLGIGGSRINSGITANLNRLPSPPALITVLWGYNDAVYSATGLSQVMDDYRNLVRTLAENHPGATICGILQTYTPTNETNNPENSIQLLRAGQSSVLKELNLEYGNIRIIDGWEITTAEDLADAVHLNDDGAQRFAYRLAGRLKKETPFAPPAAEWHYGEKFYSGDDLDYIWFHIDGDTIIHGRKCSVLRKRHQLGCYLRPGTEYLYTDSGIVWLWDAPSGSFQKLYDFNARKGDTWHFTYTGDDEESMHCSVTVDSVYYTDVNEQDLLSMDVTYKLEFGTLEPEYTSTITQRIGDHNYLFNFYPESAGHCNQNLTDGLRCYHDNDIGLFKTGTVECDQVLSGTGSSPVFIPGKIRVFPNPGYGHFRIRGIDARGGSFSLINASGVIVKEGALLVNELHIEGLAPGPYFLLVTDKENHRDGEMIILD